MVLNFHLTVFIIFRKGSKARLRSKNFFFIFGIFLKIFSLEKHFFLGYTNNKETDRIEDVLGKAFSSDLDITWGTNVASWQNCVYMAKGFFNRVRCSEGMTCKQLLIFLYLPQIKAVFSHN